MTFDPIEKAVCESLERIPDEAATGGWLWERGNWMLSCTLFRLKRPFLVTLNWTKSDEVS